MSGPHPSHKTRFSWDASTYDEICELCGATDMVPGGWGELAFPCPNNPDFGKVGTDNEALRRACHLEDDE